MDLDTITVADFKAYFRRDFPYLPTYDDTKLYNAGARVYFPDTELFYDCTENGTTDIPPDYVPTPPAESPWTIVADDIDNYILDEDITKAFGEAQFNLNQSLFDSDAQIRIGYYYLTAMYLVHDIRAGQRGISAAPAFNVTSRSVGNVSESYGIPEAYLQNPIFQIYTQSPYGLKYLSLVLPYLVGNIGAVCGATHA